MLGSLAHIPFLYLLRATGRPRCLPINLTFSITYHCNSRCCTCKVHNIPKKISDELDLDEWQRVFRSLGKAPFWVTISGGEPFLREDLVNVVLSLYETCHPSIINIPTNGLLTRRITEWTAEMARCCSKAQMIINLSVDEVGDRHDEIRGVEGGFKRVMETFHSLKQLHQRNLTVGFHTVISRFNVDRIPNIYDYLTDLNPDSIVAEIAEEREELGTMGWDIAPAPQAYDRAADYLISPSRKGMLNRMGKIACAFRVEYHQLVKLMLKEQRQVIPCYAGVASAHVASNGDVWACCTRAESMGSLRENGYDFKGIWFSEKAAHIRKSIKEKRCWCPLANVSYTNMLLHPVTLFRAAQEYMMGDPISRTIAKPDDPRNGDAG